MESPPDEVGQRPPFWQSPAPRVLGGLIVGLAATGVTAYLGFTRFSLLIGWDFLALTFMVWTWAVVGPYGVGGVAASVAAGIAGYNLVLWFETKRKTGMLTHVSFGGFSEAIRTVMRKGR